jgi:hypothetical protein
MITVKYRCRQHGPFSVDLDLGGRGRLGRAPISQPCSTCQADSLRMHSLNVPVNDATYRRMRSYCEAHGIPMAQLVIRALKGIVG